MLTDGDVWYAETVWVPQDAGTVREALLLAASSNDARRIAVAPGIPTYAAVSYADVCRRTRMRMLLTYSCRLRPVRVACETHTCNRSMPRAHALTYADVCRRILLTYGDVW
jgi:hypothetical protein